MAKQTPPDNRTDHQARKAGSRYAALLAQRANRACAECFGNQAFSSDFQVLIGRVSYENRIITEYRKLAKPQYKVDTAMPRSIASSPYPIVTPDSVHEEGSPSPRRLRTPSRPSSTSPAAWEPRLTRNPRGAVANPEFRTPECLPVQVDYASPGPQRRLPSDPFVYRSSRLSISPSTETRAKDDPRYLAVLTHAKAHYTSRRDELPKPILGYPHNSVEELVRIAHRENEKQYGEIEQSARVFYGSKLAADGSNVDDHRRPVPQEPRSEPSVLLDPSAQYRPRREGRVTFVDSAPPARYASSRVTFEESPVVYVKRRPQDKR